MAIKCVVVDLGGVVIEVNKKSAAERFAPHSAYSQDELYALLTGQKADDNEVRAAIRWFDKGAGLDCSDYDFYWRMVSALKLDAAKIDFFQFRAIYADSISFIPEMLDLLARIRGVRLGVISNICRIHQAIIHPRIQGIFDFFVYSYVEQTEKPGVLIYSRAQRSAGVAFHEMLFHDDVWENLKAAILLGMNTCFHDPVCPPATNVWMAEKVMRQLGITIV